MTWSFRQPGNEKQKGLADRVRTALRMLSVYGVFDRLSYSVTGNKVTLEGIASRPILRTRAESAAASLPGVESVDNRITILPFSINDDRIRASVYCQIYCDCALSRYANGAVPRAFARFEGMIGITNHPPLGHHEIRIMVQNGTVTLEGIINDKRDRALAETRANQSYGVVSVINNLTARP